MKESTTRITETSSDTIVAIATPQGAGSVGIVRLSGPNSLTIAQKIFRKKGRSARSAVSLKPQRISYGVVFDSSENVLDDGYVAYFKRPRSFTGEDIIEFQLHGNNEILSAVLERCCKEGARQALPGEFTRRAFENGKLDLLQAEAVAEIVSSRSQIEAKRARMRLDGQLSSHVEELRKDVIEVLAELEANVDFPDEEIPLEQQSQLLGRMDELQEKATSILSTYDQNQKISTGFRIVLVGKPNVGKSSLFNAILQHDRAIVTDIAGTTRDVLSEEIILGGYRVKLLDTAGLRSDVSDEVEREGVARSGSEIDKADLVLFMVDATQPLPDPHEIPKDSWVIVNKVDIKSYADLPAQVGASGGKVFEVSAITAMGIPGLLEAIRKYVVQNKESFGGGISNDRQYDLLKNVVDHAQKTQVLIRDKVSPELASFEFRQSYQSLNKILGKEEDMEEVLDRVFSKFCIGK